MQLRRLSLGGGAVIVAAVVVVVLAVALQEASAQLCPVCECPATYQLVCGKTVDKDGKVRFRGFSSRCVMECNNQCRKTKFEFVKRGRCGPKVAKPTRNPNENSVLSKGNPATNTTMSGAKIIPTVPTE